MIRVQRNSGARPGEVCAMRRCDLSLSPAERLPVPGTKAHFRVSALEIEGDGGGRVPIWLYVPARHKTTHRGKVRVIVLAPPAQEALRPFLDRPSEAFLFSPKEEQGERFIAMRKARKTRVQPSQKCRKKRRPVRSPGVQFTTDTYRRSIKRAIARANRARRKTDPNAELLPEWHPHQLRHGAATATAERFDESFVTALLGHSGTDMIATYVKQTIEKAARAAAKLE
jgi:integrase